MLPTLFRAILDKSLFPTYNYQFLVYTFCFQPTIKQLQRKELIIRTKTNFDSLYIVVYNSSS